jgi:hypothetical protein
MMTPVMSTMALLLGSRPPTRSGKLKSKAATPNMNTAANPSMIPMAGPNRQVRSAADIKECAPVRSDELSVIDKVRRFFHRRVEPQIFMSIFSVFMPSGDLDSHEDFVRLNIFNGPFFLGSVNVDPIAGLQHSCSLQPKLR